MQYCNKFKVMQIKLVVALTSPGLGGGHPYNGHPYKNDKGAGRNISMSSSDLLFIRY